jgi:glycosyltransferase involved in cell wall biosynthesis
MTAQTRPSLTVIILTYNEEANIAQSLRSVADWAEAVFVLDSFSTDRTVERARDHGAVVVQREFAGYASQRNYALANLPITTEWVLFLDADEWVPNDLRDEITSRIQSGPKENGFLLRYRLIWNGVWIRRGYYPTWILRLFRHGVAKCESREVNEHLVVEGQIGRLWHDFIHEDRKGIGAWIAKHNAYATVEATELLRGSRAGYLDARLLGSQAQRKRWLRYRVWGRLPPLLRPFVYFVYRYVLLGGFLDGREAFVFHFLHALWYQFVIDLKYLELRTAHRVTVQVAPQDGRGSDYREDASRSVSTGDAVTARTILTNGAALEGPVSGRGTDT